MVSEKQYLANRRNARKSTGPKTPEDEDPAEARVKQLSADIGIAFKRDAADR